MTVPRLAHGYGPHGYEVLARSGELEPWIESLFLDVADRWPFSEVRESLVLVRREHPTRGSHAVLVRSRLHQGKPVHRQTSMALFRLDDLVRTWGGLLPLVECLPPYVPSEAILPDVVIRSADLTASRWGTVSLGKDWFSDAWARLVAGERIRLPEVDEREESEILDLLACTLPPQVAARMNIAAGLQRGGLLSAGPAVEGRAEDGGHNRKSPGPVPPGHETPLAWIRRIAARGRPDASIADLGLAVREAIVELARLERVEPKGVSASLLAASTQREAAIDWMVAGPPVPSEDVLRWFHGILGSETRLSALNEVLGTRLKSITAQSVAGAADRLAWVVRRLEGHTTFARRVPEFAATLLFEGDIRGLHESGGALRVPSKVAFPRYQGPPGASTDGIEARYWGLVGRWLAEELRHGAREVGVALSLEWNRGEALSAAACLPELGRGSPQRGGTLRVTGTGVQAGGSEVPGATAKPAGPSLETTPLHDLVRAYVQFARHIGQMEPELLHAARGLVEAGGEHSRDSRGSDGEGT